MKSLLSQGSGSGKSVSLPTANPVRAGFLQRRCACGQHTIAGGECEACRRRGENTLRRAAVVSSPGGIARPSSTRSCRPSYATCWIPRPADRVSHTDLYGVPIRPRLQPDSHSLRRRGRRIGGRGERPGVHRRAQSRLRRRAVCAALGRGTATHRARTDPRDPAVEGRGVGRAGRRRPVRQPAGRGVRAGGGRDGRIRLRRCGPRPPTARPGRRGRRPCPPCTPRSSVGLAPADPQRPSHEVPRSWRTVNPSRPDRCVGRSS